MTEERDAMIEHVVSSLRMMPDVDHSAKARVLVAVAAERERAREDAARPRMWRQPARWILRGAGLAAAAGVAAFMLRGPQHARHAIAPATSVTATPPARLAVRDATTESDAARQSVQLVFRAPQASNVRVVGDFNEWDRERAPMARDAKSGLWSTTLLLRPGRHVYAFVVDDTLWVRDPRAPAAPDADFGRPGSVLLVGRP